MEIQLTPLSADRLGQAKWAYTTRRVDREIPVQLLSGKLCPEAGDLLLARIEELGHHRRLELISSRRATLFEGDEVVLVYGNRYAPDQFEGIVPDHLGPCRLVAAGGIAARLLNRHDRVRSATRITPLGLLADKDGHRINLSSARLPKAEQIEPTPLVLAVTGTAMNSGKTTACANLVKGFVRQKIRVAAAKFTGTGAGADYRALVDAGANPVFDFVDAGYASTYRAGRDALHDIVMTLGAQLAAAKPDIIVIEIADGLLQHETSRLFATPSFTSWIDGVMFAANDALGAQAGVSWLTSRLLPVFAITGVLTSSPLARQEAEDICGLPVYHTNALARTSVSSYVYSCLQFRRKNRTAAANMISA